MCYTPVLPPSLASKSFDTPICRQLHPHLTHAKSFIHLLSHRTTNGLITTTSHAQSIHLTRPGCTRSYHTASGTLTIRTEFLSLARHLIGAQAVRLLHGEMLEYIIHCLGVRPLHVAPVAGLFPLTSQQSDAFYPIPVDPRAQDTPVYLRILASTWGAAEFPPIKIEYAIRTRVHYRMTSVYKPQERDQNTQKTLKATDNKVNKLHCCKGRCYLN